MKLSHILTMLALLAIVPLSHAESPHGARIKYNFNSDWLVKVSNESGAEPAAFVDADWKRVTLPYAWNEDRAFKEDIADLPTGVAWYRKHFKLPPGAAGKRCS